MTLHVVNGYHIYEFDGIRYPSVTTILSKTADPDELRGLEHWRKNFYMPGFSGPEEYTAYTAFRGTLVHYNVLNSVIQKATPFSLDMSELPKFSDIEKRISVLTKEITHCRNLWDTLDLNIRAPLSAETATYHPGKRYAGTLDLRAKIDGVNTILDLKTSKEIWDKQILQVAAYVQAHNAFNPANPVEQGIVVSLNPGKQKPLIKRFDGEELTLWIEEFNERLKTYWDIPSVRRQYGL